MTRSQKYLQILIKFVRDVTELLNSRNKSSVQNEIEPASSAESVIVSSVPKDIFIEISDDLLAEMPRDIPPTGSDELSNSPDILVDIESVDKSSDTDAPTPLNMDLIGLLDLSFSDIQDIPVILEENTGENVGAENVVEESVNLMNFEETEAAKSTNQKDLNDSFDLLDLDEIVEELNKSLEPEVMQEDYNSVDSIGSEDNFPTPQETEPEVSNSKKRKPECMEDDNLVQQPSKTILISGSVDKTELASAGLKTKEYIQNKDHEILRLQKLELLKHVETANEVRILRMLNQLLRMNVNLDMILTNTIGKILTHLKQYKSVYISRIAGRLSSRWKKILVSSSSTEYNESVLKALSKKWVTGSRAKLLMDYISNNDVPEQHDDEVEEIMDFDTAEVEPEVDTNTNENEHEVDANKNTQEPINVDEILTDRNPEMDDNEISQQGICKEATNIEEPFDEMYHDIDNPEIVANEEEVCEKANHIEKPVDEIEDPIGKNCELERIGMKDLPR